MTLTDDEIAVLRARVEGSHRWGDGWFTGQYDRDEPVSSYGRDVIGEYEPSEWTYQQAIKTGDVQRLWFFENLNLTELPEEQALLLHDLDITLTRALDTIEVLRRRVAEAQDAIKYAMPTPRDDVTGGWREPYWFILDTQMQRLRAALALPPDAAEVE